MRDKAVLVLSDGTYFNGYSFGYNGDTSGEVVFNTSMIGYQEIITDPSYAGQIVTMTYTQIGNYGINFEDVESGKIYVEGFIVKEYQDYPSNWRCKQTLAEYLKKEKIVAIEGIDTRALVKHIRDYGAQQGIISTTNFNISELQEKASKLPSLEGQNLVDKVSCEESYKWSEGDWDIEKGYGEIKNSNDYFVVAYDFGIKRNILRLFTERGIKVVVVPADTSYKKVLSMNPDGIFLSNGPGDPAAVDYAIENVKNLIGKKPLFGICLGHQILGLAIGCKTYKLKFGHHGGNQPIKNLSTNKVEIAAENHGFAISEDSVPDYVKITHKNLNDGTIEGIKSDDYKFFSVQYHPESSPGPHDSRYLFDKFIKFMDLNKEK
jgi:carbamoyl-phosphate synthase small subunit